MPIEASTDASTESNDEQLCRSMQKEEFDVLESIYPEYVSTQALDGSVKLEIPIEFGSPRSVTISEDSPWSAQASQERVPLTISISTLPPLLIHVVLPPSYPLHTPPELTSIRATHVWLPDTAPLQRALLDMWQDGEATLYNWVEYIRTGEFLHKLGISDGDTISLPHAAPRIIAPLLTAYDKSSQSNQFAQSTYPCSICLTTLKGSKCLQLLCSHIFCRACLEDFWGLCIAEGDVSRVGCPDPNCVKKGTEASEEEVARVVTDTELQRWKWLIEKRNIERDPTVVHCPVAVCQTPVPMQADVDAESGWSRLRQCPRCAFTFCAFCKRTWHGPLDKCPIAQYEDLASEYLGAEEGSETRGRLERRYGRANIRRLVAAYEEEKANMAWLQSSTTMCPGCQCHIEKTKGCNHMTCWKCLQHFCYRCGQRLKADQPYAHFSQPGQGCFNQLFDVVEVDEADWEEM